MTYEYEMWVRLNDYDHPHGEWVPTRTGPRTTWHGEIDRYGWEYGGWVGHGYRRRSLALRRRLIALQSQPLLSQEAADANFDAITDTLARIAALATGSDSPEGLAEGAVPRSGKRQKPVGEQGT